MNKDVMINQISQVSFQYEAYLLNAESTKIVRNYLMLNAFEGGLSHKQIAIASGISESRVKHIILDYKKSYGK